MMDSSSTENVIHCKAAVCWAPGEPLSIEEIEVEPPKKGEVRVKLLSTGICHSDITGWNGKIGTKFPCVLGHEGAGVVESIGESVTSVIAGDFVLLLPLGQCKECEACKRPDFNICSRYRMSTTMCDETTRFHKNKQMLYLFFGVSSFSEYTVVDEARIGKINPKANMDEVCLFSCGFPTGFGTSVNVAKVSSESTVAVWGLGAVGLAAVYGAHKNGAALIIGIDTNESKKEAALKFGCHQFVNPLKCKKENTNTEEKIKSLTNGIGVDFALDCVGGSDVVMEAINCSAPWGKIVVVGLSGPKNLDISPNIFFSGKQLMGSYLGGYKMRDQIPRLVDEYVNGEIEIKELITGKIRLDEINKAFEWLIQGKALRTVILF